MQVDKVTSKQGQGNTLCPCLLCLKKKGPQATVWYFFARTFFSYFCPSSCAYAFCLIGAACRSSANENSGFPDRSELRRTFRLLGAPLPQVPSLMFLSPGLGLSWHSLGLFSFPVRPGYLLPEIWSSCDFRYGGHSIPACGPIVKPRASNFKVELKIHVLNIVVIGAGDMWATGRRAKGVHNI
jgi:hypothetical protein